MNIAPTTLAFQLPEELTNGVQQAIGVIGATIQPTPYFLHKPRPIHMESAQNSGFLDPTRQCEDGQADFVDAPPKDSLLEGHGAFFGP